MLDERLIVAMAVAAIAEECKVEPKRVNVLSFKEEQKSSLTRYIEENRIPYHKYQLGEMADE